MTRIIVRELIWDGWNLRHINKHNVTKEEVEIVGENFTYHQKGKKDRYLVVGRSGSRIITIVIKRQAKGAYYLVTARDSDKKERRKLYEKEKNK